MTQRLSIVVPSYQQAPYIRQTLESLIHQRNIRSGELEIIVIDGGSTDGSVEILREFEEHLAYWVSEPDRGQTHALTKGFERATGNILGWLCSDDLLEPGAAREVLDLFESQPAVRFAFGDAWWIDEKGRITGPKREIPFNWFIWNYDHNYIPQPSAFWRRDLFDEVDGLDERFDLAMDGDLFARFAERTNPLHVRSYWSRIRRYPQQKTQRLRERSLSEVRDVSRRHGARNVSAPVRLAAFAAAKGLRVTWKLVHGCYRA